MKIVLFLSLFVIGNIFGEGGYEVFKGSPRLVAKPNGKVESAEMCSNACLSENKCLLWKYNVKSKKCWFTLLKVKDIKKTRFGVNRGVLAVSTISAFSTEWVTNPVTGVSYLISDPEDKRNWVSAALRCNTLGSRLAKLDSEEEDTFVKALLIPDETNPEGWFIGAQDVDNAFNFLWIEGTRMEGGYTNFHEGEPNNVEGKEHCLIKYSKNASTAFNDLLQWNDVHCYSELPYVCQKPVIDGYTRDPSTGNYYKFLTDKERTWMEAKVRCEQDGGELASIKNDPEWQFVKGIMDDTGDYVVWLGGSDAASEGNWVWTDGSPVSYSNWYGSEPNSGTGYNCLLASSYYNWQWFDTYCTWTYYAVCKIPA